MNYTIYSITKYNSTRKTLKSITDTIDNICIALKTDNHYHCILTDTNKYIRPITIVRNRVARFWFRRLLSTDFIGFGRFLPDFAIGYPPSRSTYPMLIGLVKVPTFYLNFKHYHYFEAFIIQKCRIIDITNI